MRAHPRSVLFRSIALFSVLALAAACGGGDGDEDATATSPSSSAAEADGAAAEAPTADELEAIATAADGESLTREEAASLLALETMLQLARSQDLCDHRGVPLSEQQVRDYLSQEVCPDRWGLLLALQGSKTQPPLELDDGDQAPPEAEPTENGTGPLAPPTDEAPSRSDAAARVDNLTHANKLLDALSQDMTTHGHEAPSGGVSNDASNGVADSVQTVLLRLRVASVDRVIREVHRLHPKAGRSAVAGGLDALGNKVQWFGRSIVAWADESPASGSSSLTRGIES